MGLFPLGLLSQGGGATGGPSYELISTATSNGAVSVISFSSIPSAYSHLQIRYNAKNTVSALDIRVTLNNNTGANYAWHNLLSSGSLGTNSGSSTTYINLAEAMTYSSTAYATSAGIIEISDIQNTNKNKTLRAVYGSQDTLPRVYYASGFFNSTAPITDVTFTASGNNFAALTRFSLYGIRA